VKGIEAYKRNQHGRHDLGKGDNPYIAKEIIAK